MDRLACPYWPICDPVVDGVIVRRDGVHVTSAFAASMADGFEDHLDEIGVLRP